MRLCELPLWKIGNREIIRPYNDQDIHKTTEQQRDTHLYDGDVTIEINNIGEIDPKIITFEQTGKRYNIGINWDKFLIIARGIRRNARDIKATIPENTKT